MAERQHHHHPTDPSGPASVTLDIGGDSGALIIYTGPAELGREIEVSLDEPGAVRTHAAVRARTVRPHTLHCVVLPSLPAGQYVIWDDEDTPRGRVMVTGGRVAEYQWSGLPEPVTA